MASLHGAGPVASQFEPCADVPRAGVLFHLTLLFGSFFHYEAFA